MATDALPRFTEEHYLSLERQSETKSEYYNGEIFAMSGASFPHNCLQIDLALAIGPRLLSRECDVLGSDQRLKIQATGLITYPDLIVLCGPPQFAENAVKDTLVNPALIAEVLSPSTESYDRGKKFLHYRQIPSLRDYLLVSQDRVLVEHFTRQPDDSWTFRAYPNREDILPLLNFSIEIPLRDIYRRVTFESVEPNPPA
jgi:Uma2 family endonuclease